MIGLTPERAARLCSARLDLPPLEWEEVRSRTGARLYSFRTQRLVELREGEPPTFVYRCQPVIALEAIDLFALRRLGASCAEHIARREWMGAEPFGLRADYSATTGYSGQPFADARAQGLAAYALARYAELPEVSAEERARLLRIIRRVLDDLLLVHDGEEDPFVDTSSLSSWLLGVGSYIQSIDREDGDELPTDLPTLLLHAQNAAKQLLERTDDEAIASRWNPGERAYVAFTLARCAAWQDDSEDFLSRSQSMIRQLLRTTPLDQLAALSPWFGLTEVELAGDEDVAAAIVLRDFRTLAWDFQVGSGDATATDQLDLVGGLAFRREGLPTWQSLRVGYLLAAMFGDDHLTSCEESPLELARLIRLARFIAQLSISHEELGVVVDARRSLGGVRLSTWDPTVSLDATSLALLTIVEILEGIEHRSEE